MNDGLKKNEIPAVSWFTFPDDKPSLIGSRCNSCGDYFFPGLDKCRNPNCRSEEVEEALLSRSGKIWSYIIQEVAPPPPFPASDPFIPYALIELKLPEGIKVLGQLAADIPFDCLEIGMQMEIITEKYSEDDQGNDVIMWKFRPLPEENEGN